MGIITKGNTKRTKEKDMVKCIGRMAVSTLVNGRMVYSMDGANWWR